ncbi:MAG TPA: hypothetical protein VHJ34_03140 [Actinomycetota bacterium]|nr:hypothetical protein [Actinomycetota bacterium]
MTESYSAESVVEIPASEMRALFNEYFLPRIEAGVLSEGVIISSKASPKSGQPSGTLSQTLAYSDGTRTVATAHRFLLKDGSLGGSGRPDPKSLVWEGTIYVIKAT